MCGGFVAFSLSIGGTWAVCLLFIYYIVKHSRSVYLLHVCCIVRVLLGCSFLYL